MLSHYFRIAYRSLLRHRAFTLLNLFGLVLGLSCSLLIFSFLRHELSYDRFFPQAEQLFRVNYFLQTEGFEADLAVTPNVVAPKLKRELPEVVNSVRVYEESDMQVRRGDTVRVEGTFLYADSTFFQLFEHTARFGDLALALRQPRSLVLSERAARRYFDLRHENPVGKTLLVGSSRTPYTIEAVVNPPPGNTHLPFDYVASFLSLGKWAWEKEIYGSANYYTYLQLQSPDEAATVEAKMAQMVEKALGERASSVVFSLQPLTRIHLHSGHIEGGPAVTGDINTVYLFGAVALLILLIACINYINLTTARSVDRAREVGLRKVVGARRPQLFLQFMSEAFLLSLLALLLSLTLAQVLQAPFNQMAQRDIAPLSLLDPGFFGLAVGLLLLVSLLAGAYPALVISGFTPIRVLRGKFRSSRNGLRLRQGLVVGQFVGSMVLILGTLVVQEQLDFIRSKKLGYEQEQLLVLPLSRDLRGKLPALKGELEPHPRIVAVASCQESPYQIDGGYSLLPGWQGGESDNLVTAMAADEDFVRTMGLKLLAGRNFSGQVTAGDQDAEPRYEFLVNERCLALLDWEAREAIGRKVNLNGRLGTIDGVINDFHFQSLHQPIGPVVIFSSPELYELRELLVRLAPGDPAEGLHALRETWEAFAPGEPFTYHFVDEQYEQLYQNERRTGQVFSVFAALAIFIACLGLFGLAAFTTVQRYKEISIRKVLGATVAQIVGLLSRDFSRWVVMAFVIAAPLGWYLMQRWLENFAYHVSLNLGAFLLCGAGSLLLAWLTVSYQSLRAARANPAEALRSE